MISVFCGEMLAITFLLAICTIVLFHIQKNEQRIIYQMKVSFIKYHATLMKLWFIGSFITQ